MASVARHHRDVARGDQHRALPEIDVEHRDDVVRDDRVGPEQIADRAVAVAGLAFRRVDGFVDGEVASGKPAERSLIYSNSFALLRGSGPEQAIAPALTIGLKG